ncbi:hypothetical protein GSI_14576 [Ganoderma sinense ZZ0214-1]|uniref:DUF6535 domain-containing protein n=1 Tax=Ganoderma sinense ZZ0214-1 TaxID=1077348 RepID=A0A2G8RP36_9APHY|nr:hypothetical protein GSI_14576 [Ganoderma sinense ZZ0214-1]
MHYPPTYWHSVAQFPNIVTLDMSTAGLSLSSILHLVWSFPELLVLRLQEDIEDERVSARKDLSETYSWRLCTMRRPNACRHLKHLKLSNARILTSMPNFPPPLSFGTSVTRLKLGVLRKLGLSHSMLACIREFDRLEFLRVGSMSYGTSERSDGHLLQHVLPVLPNVRSSAFQTLELYVSPWDPFFTTRQTHIDILYGIELKAFLERTPSLRTLGLSWPDTDAGLDGGLYDAKWWSEQLTFREELEKQYTQDEKEQVWSEAAEAVKTYHEEMVTAWDREMDTLLVYAGLFSAVLTAFNVQSYQLLQAQPTDPMLAALQQISAQLNSFTVNSPFVNATQQVQPLNDTSFKAPTSAVWINTLWFSSLVCSLASASIALMVKQWLDQLRVGLSGTSRDSARLRQYRLNGILKWQVGSIIVVLPILLQLALLLFLAGLVVLLWTLHPTVAAVTSALVGVLVLFSITVTILPTFQWDCAYLSPQALFVHELFRFQWNYVRVSFFALFRNVFPLVLLSRLAASQSALNAPPSRFQRFFAEIRAVFIWVTGDAPLYPTWRGREQLAIASPETARDLDRHVVVMAYTTTFATRYVKRADVLFPDLGQKQVPRYFDTIRAALRYHWNGPSSGQRVGRVLHHLPLHALRYMLSIELADRDARWREGVREILGHFRFMPRKTVDKGVYLDTLSAVLVDEHDRELASQVLKWIMLDLRYAQDISVYSQDTIRNVMSISEWWIQQLPTSPTAEPPHGYLYASEIVVHCIRIAACSPSTVIPTPEYTTEILAHGKTALQCFADRLTARQRSGKPLIRQSDHRDGLLVSSMTFVLQAMVDHGLHIDEVPEFSRPRRTGTGFSTALRRLELGVGSGGIALAHVVSRLRPGVVHPSESRD